MCGCVLWPFDTRWMSFLDFSSWYYLKEIEYLSKTSLLLGSSIVQHNCLLIKKAFQETDRLSVILDELLFISFLIYSFWIHLFVYDHLNFNLLISIRSYSRFKSTLISHERNYIHSWATWMVQNACRQKPSTSTCKTSFHSIIKRLKSVIQCTSHCQHYLCLKIAPCECQQEYWDKFQIWAGVSVYVLLVSSGVLVQDFSFSSNYGMSFSFQQ